MPEAEPRNAAAQGHFTPAEARRLARFLKRVSNDPEAAADDVPEALLQRAVSAGLVGRSGRSWKARTEAHSFLRRLFTADPETEYAGQHGEVAHVSAETESGRVVLRRNLDASPLDHLARLRGRGAAQFLPAQAVEAGERLLADFTRAQLQPRITASWEPRLSDRGKGVGPTGDLCDSAVAARGRFNAAVEAIGPELSGVVLDVCCFFKGLEQVETERQWPARSAKLMLRAGLLVLARHYAPPAPKGRTRHWGEAGYRPDMG